MCILCTCMVYLPILYIYLICMVNVGKYTSHMDPMGIFLYSTLFFTINSWSLLTLPL